MSVSFSGCRPALRFAIQHIDRLRPEKKMIWVDAGWSVAPMKNPQPIWYVAAMDKPRCPMSEKVFLSDSATDLAIAFVVKAPLPQPAICCLIDERREPLRYSEACLSGSPASHSTPMSPQADTMPVAEFCIPARGLATIVDRAYGLFSHLRSFRDRSWSGLKSVLTHRFGPLFMPYSSDAYNCEVS